MHFLLGWMKKHHVFGLRSWNVRSSRDESESLCQTFAFLPTRYSWLGRHEYRSLSLLACFSTTNAATINISCLPANVSCLVRLLRWRWLIEIWFRADEQTQLSTIANLPTRLLGTSSDKIPRHPGRSKTRSRVRSHYASAFLAKTLNYWCASWSFRLGNRSRVAYLGGDYK